MIGGIGTDTIRGIDGNDVITGEGGNDTLNGGVGIDCLVETANVNFTLTDTQLTGRGTDTLINIESAHLEGGVGNNRLDARGVNQLDVTLDGGAGNDILIGSNKSDLLIGSDGNDRLAAKEGNDTITGGTGFDTLYGDAGDDLLEGGDGDNTLVGGAGSDIFILDAVSGTDVINDFIDGIDSFRLSSYLGFIDLSISDNASQTATLIRDDNNQLLATINNVSANDITSDDFVGI